MRILQLAPAWEAVPPKAYGGTEAVVDVLARALAERGHEVLLACASDSTIEHSRIRRVGLRIPSLRSAALIDGVKVEDKRLHEIRYIASALQVAVDEDVDIIHNHSGEFVMAFTPRNIPMLTTAHCLTTPDTIPIWRAYRGYWNTISNAQRHALPFDGGIYAGTVYNAIDVASFPFSGEKEEYLLFMGRMSPEKGPHIAARVAQTLGRRLVLAGKIDPDKSSDAEYFETQVEPLLDDDMLTYVGEAGPRRKRQLYRSALATLVPIEWEEPFGLVMAESLACGTPVIAFRRGAAPEIVRDGITGFVVDNEDEMVRAVSHLHEINPADCRRDMEERFDVPVMADAYEALYEKIIGSCEN